MPKVSVVIPVYNVEKYLSRCLDSVCNQTLSDIEIICVNDCSPDNSIDILNNRAKNDNRIKVIDFKQNQGVSVARNTGIEAATGEYIAFVDPDDWIDLEFYEKLYHKAIAENADIAKGDLNEITLNGKINKSPLNSIIKDKKSKFYFLFGFTTAIYSLTNIKEHNIKFANGICIAEDILFLNENIIPANKVAIVDDVFYYYERREDSALTNNMSLKNIKSVEYSYKKILNNIYNINNITAEEYSFICNSFLSSAIGFTCRNNDIEYKKECVNLIFYIFNYDNKLLALNLDFIKKYSAIYSIIKQNNFNEALDFFIKNNTNQRMLIANLRFNTVQKKKVLNNV